MSYAQNILSEIRSLTEKIKRDENKPSTAYAQSDFIERLLRMEKDYNSKTKEKMPDYEKILPPISSPFDMKLKDQETLAGETSDYIKELTKQSYSKIKDDARQKTQNLLDSQTQATKDYQQLMDKNQEAFSQEQQNISDKTTRQGITHSSIREQMLNESATKYLDIVGSLQEEYSSYNENLQKQIEMVHTAKEQAIMEFNIKAAAEYEKKLNSLKEEQLKAIEDMLEYNKTLQEEQLKRQQIIKELEENWHIDQKQKEIEKTKEEMQSGYSGEKALEMENRYQMAKSYYKDMDKDKALSLMEKDKDVLKSVLGLYYNKLFNEIKN